MSKNILPYLFVLCQFLNLSAFPQTPHLDSLLNVLKTIKEDTAKANTLQEICRAYKSELNNLDKVQEYAERLYIFSKNIGFKKGIAYGLFFKGICYWGQSDYTAALDHYKRSLALMRDCGIKNGESSCYLNIGQVYAEFGNYKEALQYMLKGIAIKEELNDKKGARIGYNNIGNIYATMGDYTQGLNYYFKTLRLAEELKDQLGISYAYDNIGNILHRQNKLDVALIYYKKAATIQEEVGDMLTAGSSYNCIGNIYQTQKQYLQALTFHLMDLKTKEPSNNKQGLAIACNSIGIDYYGLKKFEQALTYQLRSLHVCKQISYKKGIVEACNGIGNVFEQKKDYPEALKYYDEMLTTAKELDYKEGMRDAFKNYASLYSSQKDFEKAVFYTDLFHATKDSLLNKENFKQVSELNTRYETDKKQKEIQLLLKDQQLNAKIIKQQNLVRWGLIGGLGLLSVSIFSIYRRYRFKQKASTILHEQKEKIEQQNILITDSIDYAKTIQEAVLPHYQKLHHLFPESFVILKPKNIVSGDFFWIKSIHNKIFIAVVDCKENGVSGAFISLLVYTILENSIEETLSLTPSFIMNRINEEIVVRLSAEHPLLSKSMNISVICLDTHSNQLEFTSCNQPIYIIRDKEIIELQSDSKNIGNIKDFFTNLTFELEKNDMIYLFTDGLPVQIQEPKQKNHIYPVFKKTLVSINDLQTEMQRKQLQEMADQKQNTDQKDDILIIGIRYSSDV